MKLFKQTILGNTDGSIGINQNYRTSFGYTDDGILVKVEKIIKPDLTRI